MGFKEVASLDTDTTIALGGTNKKTGKPNPVQVEGYFIGSKTVESKMSKDGFAKLHILQTSKGNVGVWGKTDLDRKMLQVTPGAMIRITQNGRLELPGKMPMYKFKVEVDSENTIEVSAPAEQQEEQGYSEPNAEFDTPAGGYEDSTEESYEEEALDEVQPTRPSKPAVAAAAPDAARQQKVKELLAKGRAKSA
jgi:hypothetical protein